MRLEFDDPDITVRVTDDGRTDVAVPVPGGRDGHQLQGTGTLGRTAPGAACRDPGAGTAWRG